MNNIIVTFLLMFAGVASACPARFLSPDYVAMEGWKIDQDRDPYLPYAQPGQPGESWRDGGAFDFDLTVLGCRPYRLYMQNTVHADETTAQVRATGWQWEAGLDFSNKIDIFWYHHSQHIIEDESKFNYPLVNRYGVRVIFYESYQYRRGGW